MRERSNRPWVLLVGCNAVSIVYSVYYLGYIIFFLVRFIFLSTLPFSFPFPGLGPVSYYILRLFYCFLCLYVRSKYFFYSSSLARFFPFIFFCERRFFSFFFFLQFLPACMTLPSSAAAAADDDDDYVYLVRLPRLCFYRHIPIYTPYTPSLHPIQSDYYYPFNNTAIPPPLRPPIRRIPRFPSFIRLATRYPPPLHPPHPAVSSPLGLRYRIASQPPAYVPRPVARYGLSFYFSLSVSSCLEWCGFQSWTAAQWGRSGAFVYGFFTLWVLIDGGVFSSGVVLSNALSLVLDSSALPPTSPSDVDLLKSIFFSLRPWHHAALSFLPPFSFSFPFSSSYNPCAWT